MLFEVFLIIKPDDIVIIDMVPKVLVAHILVGAVRRATDPAHEPAEARIVMTALKDQIVTALVNQIRGNRHGMGKQQRRQQIDNPRRRKEPGDTKRIADDHVRRGCSIVTQSFGLF